MTSLKPCRKDFCEPLKSHGTRWKNFYRSQDKFRGNRYEAKCGYCLVSVYRRPERLHNHVLRCPEWPIAEKTIYIQEATKDTENLVQTKCPREEVVSPIVTRQTLQQQSLLGWVSKPMSSKSQNTIDDLLLEAIIYGGISLNLANNISFKKFANALCSTYKVPSSKTLRGRVLTEMFSKLLLKKLEYLHIFPDYTICFDGWTDVSGNLIYAFMVPKEEREDALDIIDLSEIRHTSLEFKQRLLSDLLLDGDQIKNALACVTDRPSNMVKLRNNLKALHPNIIPIRCCQMGSICSPKILLDFLMLL